MAGRAPLTTTEKEQIVAAKRAGTTLRAIAQHLGIRPITARKWWRIARDHGSTALAQPRRARGAAGWFRRFPPAVATTVAALVQARPTWGPDRLRVALQQTPALAGMRLPKRSQLAAYRRTQHPTVRRPRAAPRQPPPTPTAVHGCWQLDCREAIRLHDGDIATICTIRDVVSSAQLAATAFSVATPKAWRKLTWHEIRTVIRTAATHYGTLPDAVLTDNELVLSGSPTERFPSRLTLWLVGLGVVHQRIRPRTPTDQAAVERSHRTLGGWVDADRADVTVLQQGLERELVVATTWYPSRAGTCAGRPPVQAHPQLMRASRPYQPAAERQLFDEQRVYAYLAQLRLRRQVNAGGQLSIGGVAHYVGTRAARQSVMVTCDPLTRSWVVTAADDTVITRLPIRGYDVTSLTGLPDEPPTTVIPLQLTLPFLAA